MDGNTGIWVYGAGAVGSAVGGLLAQAGSDVTLIGRDPHMAAIRDHGLRIDGVWGEHHITSRLDARLAPPEGAPPPAVVFLTVKSYDTRAAADALAPLIGPDTLVVSVQNGVGNVQVLEDVLGAERVIAGMIIIGFEMPAPGRVTVTVQADAIRLGRRGGEPDAAVRRVVDLLRDAGMPAEAEPNIEGVQWGKVLYNSALNPLGAIHECHYGALLAPDSWATIEQIIAEAFAVFAKADILVRWQTAEEYLAYLRDVQIPATFEHRPSMLTDLRERGRTEIDVMNGAIVAAGERVGVPTPVNARLCDMIRERSARPAQS